MKQTVEGSLIARLKGPDALIKDMQSVLVCSQFFRFIAKKTLEVVTQVGSQSQILKKMNQFQQTRSQMKAYNFFLH